MVEEGGRRVGGVRIVLHCAGVVGWLLGLVGWRIGVRKRSLTRVGSCIYNLVKQGKGNDSSCFDSGN